MLFELISIGFGFIPFILFVIFGFICFGYYVYKKGSKEQEEKKRIRINYFENRFKWKFTKVNGYDGINLEKVELTPLHNILINNDDLIGQYYRLYDQYVNWDRNNYYEILAKAEYDLNIREIKLLRKMDQFERKLDDIILSDIICQDMIDSEHIILIKDDHAFIQDKCKINNRISKIVRNENEEPYLEVKPTEINGQYYIVTDTKVYRYLSEQEKTKKLYK